VRPDVTRNDRNYQKVGWRGKGSPRYLHGKKKKKCVAVIGERVAKGKKRTVRCSLLRCKGQTEQALEKTFRGIGGGMRGGEKSREANNSRSSLNRGRFGPEDLVAI